MHINQNNSDGLTRSDLLSGYLWNNCLPDFSSHFFIVKQQKPTALIFPENYCARYVVLTILNYIILNVLRTHSAHTTPTFLGLKVDVYGMKGGRLWDEKW